MKTALFGPAIFLVIALAVTTGSHTAYADDQAATPSNEVRAGIEEINKTWNTNLITACKDCKYDPDTRTTTCSFDGIDPARQKHHQSRCEIALWSANVGANRRFSNCNEYFVGPDGHMSYGGRAIIREIVQTIIDDNFDDSSAFLDANDCLAAQPVQGLGVMAICPNFKKFDTVKRIQFYEYLMENIAFREVSCVDKAPSARGMYGHKAVCAFQLEGDLKTRKTRDLPNCSVSDATIRTNEGCAKCATDIMHHSLEANKRPGHSICAPFGRFIDGKLTKVYWQSLNPPNTHQANVQRKVLNDLHWFPGCLDNPQPWPKAPVVVHAKRSKASKKAPKKRH